MEKCSRGDRYLSHSSRHTQVPVPATTKLKLSASQANYLRSLPIHSTQKEIERSSEYSIFKMHLCPEFDFQMEVLSMGEDIEVLEPLWLREEIACKIKRMLNKYK